MNFISTTKLQRNTKEVLTTGAPFQVILSNSEVTGIVINQEAAKLMLESDMLTQIREELWESQDPETVQMIQDARAGKMAGSIELGAFRKKHGV